MKTSYIKSKIMSDFAKKYKSASPFVKSGDLWDSSIKTITNPILLSNIIFANDLLDVPPVRSLLVILERNKLSKGGLSFTNQESQWLGALMGYLFKFVFEYKNQKGRCPVNVNGVKTATRFFDCPTIIEIEE